MTPNEKAKQLAQNHLRQGGAPLNMAADDDRDNLIGYIADSLGRELTAVEAGEACATYAREASPPGMDTKATLAPARAAFLAAVKLAPDWPAAAEAGARALWGALVALSRAELLQLANIDEADATRLGLGNPALAWCALCSGDGQARPSYARGNGDLLAFLELEDAEVKAIFPIAQEMTVEELRFHLNDERPFDWIKRSPPDRIVFEGRCWDFRHQDCECGHCWDSAGTKPTCLEEEV